MERGKSLAEEVSSSMQQTVASASEAISYMEKVADNAISESQSIEQLTTGVDQISAVVQTNSATSEESAAASEELSSQAVMMKQLIQKFKLKSEADSASAPLSPAADSQASLSAAVSYTHLDVYKRQIEGMVQGYQQKITQLGQDRTMLQWQQSAYQSISDKLVEFSRKYMSYNSPATNLFSASFFNNAILTSANGTYADLVSATGKSSSTIVLNAVEQLAEAARYTHDASGLDTSLGKGAVSYTHLFEGYDHETQTWNVGSRSEAEELLKKLDASREAMGEKWTTLDLSLIHI